MVDQPLGVTAFGAGANEVGFLEPKIGDLIVMRQAKVAVDVAQKAGARKGVRLVNFVTNPGKICAAADEFPSHMVSAGPGGGILERAGVG